MTHLREVFSRLRQAGLTLKLKKCQFGASEAGYLGHIIGGGSIQPDPSKIKAIKEYPVPTTKKEVRSWLGLTGYYRRFVPEYATISAPLTGLLRKGSPEKVAWTPATEEAFERLRRILIGPTVLKVAEPQKPFVLQTDASDCGLGAVLSQQGDDGQEHPAAYASRKLLPREVKYSVIEKECLAIVWALKTFHTYLFGVDFTIETDHRPLAWLDRMKNANARLTRWALSLQPYHFTIGHRTGTQNGNADGLSRGPCDNEEDGPGRPYHCLEEEGV